MVHHFLVATNPTILWAISTVNFPAWLNSHIFGDPLKCTTIPSEISIYEAFRCRPLLQMKQSVDQRTAGAVKCWFALRAAGQLFGDGATAEPSMCNYRTKNGKDKVGVLSIANVTPFPSRLIISWQITSTGNINPWFVASTPLKVNNSTQLERIKSTSDPLVVEHRHGKITMLKKWFHRIKWAIF